MATAELLPGRAMAMATGAPAPERTSGQPAVSAAPATMSAAVLRAQVLAARERQQQRAGCLNARLGVAELATHCALDVAATRLLARGAEKLGLSGRGLHRVLCASRALRPQRRQCRVAFASDLKSAHIEVMPASIVAANVRRTHTTIIAFAINRTWPWGVAPLDRMVGG